MLFLLLLIIIQNVLTWRFLPIDMYIYKPKKRFISINPAGVYGFYTLGISSYLKDNYNLHQYYFIGASSGSWNSLLCCYKYNQTSLIRELLKQDFFENSLSISNLQKNLSNYISTNYNSEDFNLDKLYISISEFNNFELKSVIIHNFTNLENALECCILSSHIPFITSDSFIKKYRDKIAFDGGLTEFPPKIISTYFEISPSKYNSKNIEKAFLGLITKNVSIKIIQELYSKGYHDSHYQKKDIDTYFGGDNSI